MKFARITLIAVLCCVCLIGARAQATSRPVPALPRLSNTLLVRFQPEASAAERVAIVQRLNGTIVNEIAALDIAVVNINPALANGASLANVVSALNQIPAVEYAEPNVRFEIADQRAAQGDGSQRILVPIVAGIPAWIPNDFHYGKQRNIWERVNAPAGWHITRGRSTTVIAIVDTGIYLRHPDLRSKLVPGNDFVGDREPASPNDGHGHGTHVAGIAAAVTNNTTGVAGTCPNCKLMPVRVLNDFGLGDLVAVAKGIVWATDNGAKIINLSLVGYEESAALNDALEYAWSKGVLPVCAAGNRNSNNPAVYPASNPRCLTVGATTNTDTKASFSNYGPWVGIAAPGVDMYSTLLGNSYGTDSGTSMSAPMVAGAAGLLSGRGLNNAQLRQQLCSAADRIAGTGAYWECGRLNIYRAVTGR
jgi:subtilisin family serine protease